MGVCAGFSIVLLIPLLQLLNVDSGETASGLALFFRNLADNSGISITLGNILIVYVTLLTLTGLIQYRKSLIDAAYQQSFIYSLRRRLFRKIILADWNTLNSRSKTNHLQVLTREVPNLATYYYFCLRLLVSSIMAATYIGWAMMVSAGFTLLIIAIGLVIFILLRKFLLKAFRMGEETVNLYNRLLKYIDDFWQTVKIAKVHSSEDFYYRKFDEASNSLFALEYRMQKNHSLPQLIYHIAGIVVLVAIVYAGYHAGRVPLTSFFILILLFSRIFPQFVSVNTDMNMIMSNLASVRMVLDLDEELPDSEFHAKETGESIVPEREITLENLTFSYPGNGHLFTGFNAVIAANAITGILGESGIGKTTLIDIIAGLQRPSEGRMLIDGRELDDSLLPAWRQGVGYLPQDNFFIDGTLRENLVWDSDRSITDEEIEDVVRRVNATHLVRGLEKGLDTFIVNYHTRFSGGECQRLALARVLLRRPVLLLLDEATSSLDAVNEEKIMEVLRGLTEQVTIIFVTHKTELKRWFDEEIVLKG
jgi:ATP-binding cassette subfamily C protein